MASKIKKTINKNLSKFNKFIEKYKNHKGVDIVAIIFTSLFILAGILISLNRFWQYEIFYYNFGVFDQAIWHVSRFQPPIIEHLLVGGRLSLADHFDLSILLLAPIFWITQRSEALLVIQAIFTGLAGLVIYRIGFEVLKDKLISLAIASCYFLFIGIQSAVITDFHELAIMTLPVSLTFLFIIRRQLRLFWIFFLLSLGFKEVTYTLGIGIAFFIFFYNKSWRKQAILAALASVAWGYLATRVFIPYFSDGIYLHWPTLPDTFSGKILALVDEPEKRRTLFYSFRQFGFLPLFAPSMWPVILQDYIIRFLPVNASTYWILGLHYNAVVSVLLSVASIIGFSFILRFKLILKVKYLIAVALFLNALFLFRFELNGPFMLAINPAFYAHSADFKFLNNLVNKIPKDASIMTQNNLGVRFTHQDFIYLREGYEEYKPDYILIDNRAGQNPNNLLWAPSIDELLIKLAGDENYISIFNNGEQYLYKRDQ